MSRHLADSQNEHQDSQARPAQLERLRAKIFRKKLPPKKLKVLECNCFRFAQVCLFDCLLSAGFRLLERGGLRSGSPSKCVRSYTELLLQVCVCVCVCVFVKQALARLMDPYEQSRCNRYCLLCLEVCGRPDGGVVDNHQCRIIGHAETGSIPTCTVCWKRIFHSSLFPCPQTK